MHFVYILFLWTHPQDSNRLIFNYFIIIVMIYSYYVFQLHGEWCTLIIMLTLSFPGKNFCLKSTVSLSMNFFFAVMFIIIINIIIIIIIIIMRIMLMVVLL